MPDSETCDGFKIVSQTITWLLILGGWWIVNKQNNWQEQRKETRTVINQPVNDLDAIEEQAYKYHQASKTSLAMGRDIKLGLSRISALVTRESLLPRHKRQPLARLRRAITLNNFDTEHFTTQMDDSELLAEISSAKDDLIEALERHFQSQYRS
jgi:hypothetical protein